MSEFENNEVKNIKIIYLAIHKNDAEKACSGLCSSVTRLIEYVWEGIEPEWSTHCARVLYKAYLSFGKPQLTIAENFFNGQKKKVNLISSLKRRTLTGAPFYIHKSERSKKHADKQISTRQATIYY